MAVNKYRNVALYQGNPLPGVSVLVKFAGTAILAPLFSDIAGTIPQANPFINDATYGSFVFYAEDGLYDITLTKVGYTLEALPNELVGGSGILTNGPFVVPTVNGAALLTVINAIPTGAKDVGVFVHNDIGFGVSGGLASYSVGDGTTADLWGAAIGLAQDVQTEQDDFNLPPGQLLYKVPTSVILSGNGGVFDGTGQATVTVKYRIDGP